MARSLAVEIKKADFNLLWCNALLLMAAVAVGSIPFMYGVAKEPESYFWYVLAAPFVVLSLWNLEKYLRRSREPESHPFLEKVRTSGFGAVESVDQDLDQSQDFLGLSLGRSWLLKRGFFNLELESLKEAVWAYRKESHAEYLLYSQAIVHFRSGKSLSSTRTTDAKKVDLFLSQISQAVPWMIMGENDDLSKLWKKDRANFIEQVDQRRKALESQRRRMVVPEPLTIENHS